MTQNMYKLSADPRMNLLPASSCYEVCQENYQMFWLSGVTC